LLVRTKKWYHCISRCVRQAWLCGVDPATGRDYSHRKGWIEQRIRQLAGIFAIDVAAYAVMDNHYHIVLRVNREGAQAWTQAEVLERWDALFSLPKFIEVTLEEQRRGVEIEPARLEAVAERVEVYRRRLYDISWFMRVLNESIARMANREDGVKGRFWQGRFKSQAITDEAALVAVMAYVDMNPLRAGMVERVEDGEHTSLRARLEGRAETRPAETLAHTLEPDESGRLPAVCGFLEDAPQARLLPFADERRDSPIPIGFSDYLMLVDYLARAVHPRKRGHTPEQAPPIIDRLGLSPELADSFSGWSERFGDEIGRPRFHRKGARWNRRLFATAA